MIVNRKAAEEAWLTLRTYARIVDEKWDLPEYFTGWSESMVKDAYYAACKTVHPDKGGTIEQFAEVDRAKHMLLHWLKNQPVKPEVHKRTDCETCGGAGRVRKTRNPLSSGLLVQCPLCRGTGDAGLDRDKNEGL